MDSYPTGVQLCIRIFQQLNSNLYYSWDFLCLMGQQQSNYSAIKSALLENIGTHIQENFDPKKLDWILHVWFFEYERTKEKNPIIVRSSSKCFSLFIAILAHGYFLAFSALWTVFLSILTTSSSRKAL